MPRRPLATAAQVCADGALTPKAAAERMGVGLSKLYELMRDGSLPYCQLTPTMRRIPVAAVTELLASTLTSGTVRR